MAEKRKSLSKSLRFEVLKRDSFTCQYCGAKAPEAILEVDHIIPVKEGGTNDIMNLVTSCRNCNRGKSCTTLSDSSIVEKRRKAAEEAQERIEMLNMLAEWHKQLILENEMQIEQLENLMREYYPNSSFTDNGKNTAKKHIKKFGFQLVYDSFEIALNQYNDVDKAFNKLGGICYNRKYRSGDNG